jgi:hypothetical protein
VDVGGLHFALNELNRVGVRPLRASTNRKHQGRRGCRSGGDD